MIKYYENLLPPAEADYLFAGLASTVPWVRRDATPRMEAFYSTLGKPYTYGSGGFSRTYTPEPEMNTYINKLLFILGFTVPSSAYNLPQLFELCFLNRYLNQSDHLGWHADDSPEIDETRPIAVVSLGVEREIWFKPQRCLECNEYQDSDKVVSCENHSNNFTVTKQLLNHGSLLIMPAGFQQTHYHRIPKCDRTCGERISLTFRGDKTE